MIAHQLIDKAVRLLLKAAPQGTEVILFGSYARGDQRSDSDLDFLVIEPTVRARRSEMNRLREIIRPLKVPADVLVVSRAAFDAWKDLPNNVISEAVREGKSFTDAA